MNLIQLFHEFWQEGFKVWYEKTYCYLEEICMIPPKAYTESRLELLEL